MTDLVRINDEVLTSDGFIKLLKLTGRFDSLMDDVLKEKLTVHASRLAGNQPSAQAIQEQADQIRRVRGLHRAVDMNRYLDALNVSLGEFEEFVVENILYDEMNSRIVSDEAVEEYFRLNSPLFDAVDVSHIVIDSEGTAREIVAMLEDEPDMFEDMAREHSIADTKNQGGHVGRVLRGALHGDIEAKVFQAGDGAILGPFEIPGGSTFEVFRINSKTSAKLEPETIEEITQFIREEWLAARAGESRIEVY